MFVTCDTEKKKLNRKEIGLVSEGCGNLDCF